MRALFFNKRCGGVFLALRPLVVPGALPLLLGNLLVALVCPGCARPVREALGQLAPRSLPDVDNAANLLGDF